MREILFRGKDRSGVLNYQWIDGTLDNTDKENPNIIYLDRFGNKCIVGVSPETVGQYTGLTDKNGNKMFEGDIVAGAVYWLERYKNGVVAFRDGSFGLIWYRGNIAQFNPFTSMCNITYEVIGNIHDNPGLLNGE